MIFLDFEVFKYNWLVVFADTEKEEFTVIYDDAEKLTDFYNQHKDDIFVGYNIRNYDQWIFKGILAGFNPKRVNDHIIVKGKSGYTFSSLLNKFPLIFFDVMPHIPVSLKTLEGFMGDSIIETDVDFNIDRPLTPAEIVLTEKYCRADVESLINVFLKRKKEFDSHLSLISTFNLPIQYLSKTQAQLSAEILGCEPAYFDDEWDISIVDTLRIQKYAFVIDWFKQQNNYSAKLTTNVAGVPHIFAFGGLHGAVEKYHGTGLILHVDVNSFYPAIMIEYGLLSRAVRNPEKYTEIRDKRIEYKRAKNPLQAPYKIVLNGTYGICKDKHSKAYDPRRANEVCINGQLLLLDLIEHLESVKGFELIQSNTDGLIIKIPDTDEAFNAVDDVCYEWETRTGMKLDFDYIREIWQGDVNNYLYVDVDGNVERKGAYVKELSELDYNLPIVNKALVDYLVNGTPIESTINECNDLKEFQMICKITSKYKCLLHGEKTLKEHCVRVFASKDQSDGGLYKLHKNKSKADKFTSTPTHCFLINDIVNDAVIPSKLDKQFYINMALERKNKKFGEFV